MGGRLWTVDHVIVQRGREGEHCMTSRVHDSLRALKRAGLVWFNHVKIKKLRPHARKTKKKKEKPDGTA